MNLSSMNHRARGQEGPWSASVRNGACSCRRRRKGNRSRKGLFGERRYNQLMIDAPHQHQLTSTTGAHAAK